MDAELRSSSERETNTPSLQKAIDRKDKKKSKKMKKEKKSKKSKVHKRNKKKSSSSGSDSEVEEWIEKSSPSSPEVKTAQLTSSTSSANQRDEWMTKPCLFACVTRDQLRAAKEPSEKQKEQDDAKYMLDRPGQSERELNPFWANGGTGLPSEKPPEPESLSLVSTTVGDQGANWLRRGLQRAKEQAAESGRSLEEVAAERWGSLQKLEDLLSEAEGRKVSVRETRFKENQKGYARKWEENSRAQERKHYNRREDNEARREHWKKDNSKTSTDDDHENRTERDRSDSEFNASRYRRSDGEEDRTRERHVKEEHSRSSSNNYRGSFRMPSRGDYQSSDRYSESDSYKKSGLSFRRPTDNYEPSNSREMRAYQSSSSSRNWRKKEYEVKLGKETVKDERKQRVENLEKEKKKEDQRTEYKKKSPVSESGSESDTSIETPAQNEVLSDQQMNELAAKLVKAEILGNDELVNALKKKLESARQYRAANPDIVSQAKKKDAEIVILTRTDAKGFARPLQTNSAHPEPVGGRRKKQKVETHSADGQRARYFPDDDKYSLQDMFQREKLTSVDDSNEMFIKLAGKSGRQEHDYDMDDVFAERASEKESDGKREVRDRDRAIREHKHQQRTLEACRWCFESKQLQRHLVVAVGHKSYMCLPPYQSLTEGHCLIIPLHHTTCITQLDEDVWEEMQDFRKALVKMFEEDDEDCVFFETAIYLGKFPHMVWHCVPLPRESGDMASIYFKKAILESETEWSNNKKLVDLSKKDIRRSVPKGLPYFAVDFGLQGGFAHVIEDEKIFPRNFAEEIIGGMLDLDHSLWRKPRNENFDKQRKKALDFSKRWKNYDITEKVREEKRNRTDDSDSSSS